MNSGFRYLSKVLVVVSIILFSVQLADLINFTVDDTFIPLRIVDNYINGKGLVYNQGEFVEGHSDPLWVLILAAFRKSFVSETGSMSLLVISKFLSLFFGVCTIPLAYILTVKIFKRYRNAPLYGSTVVFLMSTNTYFIAWSVAGLETTLASFLYTLALLTIATPIPLDRASDVQASKQIGIARHVLLAVTLFLAALCRPETPLFAGFIYAYLLVTQPRRRNVALFGLITYAVLLSLFVVWRMNYYGDVLPNTFYAKTGTSLGTLVTGVKYAFASLGSLLGPLIITLPFILFRKQYRTDPYWLFLGLLVLNTGFVVYMGGDWMPGFRLMLPLLPAMILVCLIILHPIINNITIQIQGKWRRASAIVSVLVVGMSLLSTSRTLIRGQYPDLVSGYSSVTWYTRDGHEGVAQWLRTNSKPGELVGYGEAGLMGYINPDIKLLDFNGLFDKHIALDRKHRRSFDVDYVFDKQPEYIVLFFGLNVYFSNVIPTEDYYRAVFLDPRFARMYEQQYTNGVFTVYSRRGLKQ